MCSTRQIKNNEKLQFPERRIFSQKGKQKSPGRATSRIFSQPATPGGREKLTQINVLILKKIVFQKTTTDFENRFKHQVSIVVWAFLDYY